MSTIKLSDIRPNPNNPRTITAEQMEKLKKSIQQFPQMMRLRPIVVDGTNTILGGNMRYEALKQLGYDSISSEWIIRAEDLTEEQKMEFLAKDNINYGEWDYEELQTHFDLEDLTSWGLDIPEHKILTDAQEDDFEVPAEGYRTDIRIGDVFDIGPHRLVCGDACISDYWHLLMAGELCHMIFTDPPYNVNYKGRGAHTSTTILGDHQTEEHFRAFLGDTGALLRAFLGDTGALYVCYASRTHREFEDSLNAAGFEVRNQIIWTKLVASMGWGDYRWKHEPILYCHKAGQKLDFYGDRKQYTEWTEERTDEELIKMIKKHRKAMIERLREDQTDEQLLRSCRALIAKQENGNSSVWRFNRDTNYQHPTQKPVQLVGKAIKNSSRKGQIVGDPFVGSGTTMVACEQMGRICRAMDLDPKHCQTVINRMLALNPRLQVRKNGESYIPS